jgi:hypothetical protein
MTPPSSHPMLSREKPITAIAARIRILRNFSTEAGGVVTGDL